MMRKTLLLGLTALLIAPAGVTARQDDDRDEFAKAIIGTYAIDRGQRGDQRLSDEELEGTVKITEDRICLLRSNGDEKYVARYKIDEMFNKTAKLSLETVKVQAEDELQTESEDAVGSKGKALATLNENEGFLTIIYDAEGDEYPDDFKPDHENEHMFVLEKKSDDTE